MSGTQYHTDESLLRELKDISRDTAIIMSHKVLLKQLLEYKYLQNDLFKNSQFSSLSAKEKLLIVNALIVFRLSCIDHVHYFNESKIDFIMNEFLHAYEDFFHIKQHNFIDFEETLKINYPSAIRWMSLIESQSKLNKQLKEAGKEWVL
ncbi:MAG: hypothetical protein ISEC1_P1073 [Thiomicrorhabdus sp.]|nr:MAG: hypothetical protein ISEC1_P1073 [Thiomicrorhabdus sp.]